MTTIHREVEEAVQTIFVRTIVYWFCKHKGVCGKIFMFINYSERYVHTGLIISHNISYLSELFMNINIFCYEFACNVYEKKVKSFIFI